jgi:hypothetical protein
MRKTNYISPEIDLLHFSVEQGFGASQGSPGVNIGIGGWEVEEDDYGNNAY